jgi:hypothetical protein
MESFVVYASGGETSPQRSVPIFLGVKEDGCFDCSLVCRRKLKHVMLLNSAELIEL